MNLTYAFVTNTETCVGCLSSDRKLTRIMDESRNFFEMLFQDSLEQYYNDGPCLCWECLAYLQNALKFKRRVHTASLLLANLSKDGINLKHCLSTLAKRSITLIDNYELFENESTLENFASVKLEDPDSDCNYDEDGVFATAATVVDRSENGTEKLEPVDSDDEPLKLKTKLMTPVEDEYVPEKRKKKKKKDRTVKEKIPAKSSGKKEKPGGVVNNERVNRKLEELNIGEGKVQMVVLTWEEVEEERRRGLESVAFTRHDYRCHDCVLGFNHKCKLENHMKKHHESAGPAQCPVCRVRCRDAHALSAHKRRHRVRWRCVACGATSSRAAVAADHAARAHGDCEPTHACPTCGHRASTLGKLRIHLKNHMERQKCELCGKSFRDRTSLRTHLFIHKGEKEYSCPKCEKKFLFKKAMEVHLVTHDAPAGLYCYECDMNFKNQMSYYQHMKYNLKHIDPAKLKYACQLCSKRFVKASRLDEHHIAVHLKATPVRCTYQDCNFACSSRPVLRTHIRMLHRNLRAVRNHVCDACGKAYTTKKTLEGHMRTHTGERPFKCKLCPSTFGYEAALYNHNKLVHLKAKSGRGQTTNWPIDAETA